MSDQSHAGHDDAEESALDKLGPYLVWSFMVIVLIVGAIVMSGGEKSTAHRMGVDHETTSTSEH